MLKVRAGSTYWDRDGILSRIDKIIQHNLYNQNPQTQAQDYDFSLLKLKATLQFSKSLRPLYLPEQNQIHYSELKTIISGWGHRVEKDSSPPRELHAANVKLIGFTKCADAYGKDRITNRMFCAGLKEGGVDTCQGETQSNETSQALNKLSYHRL